MKLPLWSTIKRGASKYPARQTQKRVPALPPCLALPRPASPCRGSGFPNRTTAAGITPGGLLCVTTQIPIRDSGSALESTDQMRLRRFVNLLLQNAVLCRSFAPECGEKSLTRRSCRFNQPFPYFSSCARRPSAAMRAAHTHVVARGAPAERPSAAMRAVRTDAPSLSKKRNGLTLPGRRRCGPPPWRC